MAKEIMEISLAVGLSTALLIAVISLGVSMYQLLKHNTYKPTKDNQC